MFSVGDLVAKGERGSRVSSLGPKNRRVGRVIKGLGRRGGDGFRIVGREEASQPCALLTALLFFS